MHQTKKDSLLGKIFVDVWGYSMTIVDYYIVVKETPKQVILAPLKSEQRATGYLSGEATPLLVDGLKPEKTFRAHKRGRPDGELYLVSSLDGYGNTHHLRLWDGKPRYFNHCD